MQLDEEKTAMTIRAKKAMQEHLLSLSWEEKVASIERMNAAGRIARAAMEKALAEKADGVVVASAAIRANQAA
jgi:hypothetical protein